MEMATPPNVDRDAIRKLIKQGAGKPFSLADVRESAAALQQTHLFTQVQVNVEPEQSGTSHSFYFAACGVCGCR